MSENLIDLEEIKQSKKRWFTSMALCLSCHNRWLASHTTDTPLFKLECPKCKDQNSFASILPQEYSQEVISGK